MKKKNNVTFGLLAVSMLLAFFTLCGVRQSPAKMPGEPYAASLMSVSYAQSDYLSQTKTQALHEMGITGKRENGEKVRVAVIDTGVDTAHSAFYDSNGACVISPLSYNAGTKQRVSEYGYAVIADEYIAGFGYHGTAVCGAIVSQLDSCRGIAPDCELVVIKCQWQGDGFAVADLLAAMEYAISVNPSVINVSWGIEGDETVAACVERLIDLATEKNILVVCAAGNGGTTKLALPASIGDTICVGAVDKNNARTVYSNYGTGLDVVAPGNILVPYPGDVTKKVSGTSFAAPLVSGIAALYYAEHPQATVAEVTNALIGTAKDLGVAGFDRYFGYGLVDAVGTVTAQPGTITLVCGTKATNYSFYYGYAIQTIPSPTQDGATFAGWFLDAAYTKRIGFPIRFSEDVTLYAKWKYDCSIYIDDVLWKQVKYDEGQIIDYPQKEGFTYELPDGHRPERMGTASLDLHGTWVLQDIAVVQTPSDVDKTYDGEQETLVFAVSHPLQEQIQYTWYYNDTLLDGAVTNTIVIQANTADNGEYRCVAELNADNQIRSVAGTFAVTVIPIDIPPPDVFDTVYTGYEQTAVPSPYDESLLDVETVTATDAGSYVICVKVKMPGYVINGEKETELQWTIRKAVNTVVSETALQVPLVYAYRQEVSLPVYPALFGVAAAEDVPLPIEAGEYSVTYRTAGSENYTACEYHVTLQIVKKPFRIFGLPGWLGIAVIAAVVLPATLFAAQWVHSKKVRRQDST